MTKEQIIIRDHKFKSDKLKKAKREIKRLRKGAINLGVLEDSLRRERANKVDGRMYYGQYGYDDNGYTRDEARREARIELLEDLIREAKGMKY